MIRMISTSVITAASTAATAAPRTAAPGQRRSAGHAPPSGHCPAVISPPVRGAVHSCHHALLALELVVTGAAQLVQLLQLRAQDSVLCVDLGALYPCLPCVEHRPLGLPFAAQIDRAMLDRRGITPTHPGPAVLMVRHVVAQCLEIMTQVVAAVG